ncbi:isopentenyl-diphosphate Delta-isomerase [Serratia ureilytica]|uniref:isopentenyl-diphosphate Delta-isomerase n=1 Tax=Serratia ureilytica TaxID=300181 RepID=UPI0039B453E4
MKEYVVLLDETNTPKGKMLKSKVHSQYTPYHLAFSCYIINDGKVLLTRRSLHKKAWPGVWTGSVCGHPLPNENIIDAVHRRTQQELGIKLTNVKLALPAFSYTAVDSNNIMENELCPVFVAHAEKEIHPNHKEVIQFEWVNIADIIKSIKNTPFLFSPWMVKQLENNKLRHTLMNKV